MKKRVLSAVMTVVFLGLAAAGCGGGGGAKETLTVFNYGEYMDPVVLDMFEEETGIEVKYEEALTPEEMCDACFKKADAYTGLSQPEQACEAYEQAYRCIRESDRPIKRNDALLEEIRACYQKCGRETAFSKWEQLFVSLSAD